MEVTEIEEQDAAIEFRELGVVSILPPDSAISADNPPARSLSVSNLFGLTFVATSTGFSVVYTKDIVRASKKSKPKPSIADKFITTVDLVNVRSLDLSPDELVLAVCAESSIRFYQVAGIVRKTETKPFEARDLSSNIKDFQWCAGEQEKYLVLNAAGNLYVGRIGEEPKNVKDDVAAACWNSHGNQIAYAVDMQLYISSPDFASSSVIDLPRELPGTEEGLETEGVDSLCWISAKSMLINYVQTEGGDEIASPLFVLSASQGQLNEECCGYSVSVIPGMFSAVDHMIIPSKTGPYMLHQNFKPWKLFLVACRRSVDDHVVALGLEEMVCQYSLAESPAIPMFDSTADNVITGLAIDRTSSPQLQTSGVDEQVRTSPILLCSLLDQTVSLYSILRLDDKSIDGLVTPPSSLDNVIGASPKQSEKQTIPSQSENQIMSSQEKVMKQDIALKTTNQQQSRSNLSTFSASKSVNEQLRKTQTNSNQSLAAPSQTLPLQQEIPASAKPPSPLLPSSEKTKVEKRPAGISDMEANFLKEIDKVRTLAEEVDNFIAKIEEKDGARSSSFTRSAVEKLEHGTSALSQECLDFKRKLQENSQLLEELRDQSLDVDAWRIYVESRVEQANDSHYQDLWLHRKLHPEMDIKRKHVIDADEKLKRQITELEAHLHSLELNQRQNTYGQFQSVQCLYNTVNAQLEAAEKLAMHLAEMMELLNISPNVTLLKSKKMGKSVYTSPQAFRPETNILSTPPKSNIPEDASTSAPESARRRRDSMDSAWAGIGATRTTIKRITPAKPKVNLSNAENKNITKQHIDEVLPPRDEKNAFSVSRHVAASTDDLFPAKTGAMVQSSPSSSVSAKQEMAMSPPTFSLSSTPAVSSPASSAKVSTSLPDLNVAPPQLKLTSSKLISSSTTNTSTAAPSPVFSFSTSAATTLISSTTSISKLPSPLPGTPPLPSSSSSQAKVVAPSSIIQFPAFNISSTQAQTVTQSFTPLVSSSSFPSSGSSPGFNITLPQPKLVSSSTPSPSPTISSSSSSTPLPSLTLEISASKSTSSTLPAFTISSASAFKISSSPSKSSAVSSASASSVSLPSVSISSTGAFSISSTQASSSTSPTFNISSMSVPSSYSTPFNVPSSSSTSSISSFNVPSSSTSSISSTSTISISSPSTPPKVSSTTTPSSASSASGFSSMFTFPSASSASSSFAAASPSASGPATTTVIQQQQQFGGLSSPFPALNQQQNTTSNQQSGTTQVQEEDMDEEVSSSPAISGFGSFGLGSSIQQPSTPAANPFGVSSTTQQPPFGGLTAPTDQLFRPAGFSLPSAAPSPQTSSAFTVSKPAASAGTGGFGGFGQSSQLGSALGAFGQTRQVGFGAPTPPAASTGFSFPISGGFANAASGGGFQAFSQNQGGGSFGGFAGASNASPGFGGFGSGNSSPGFGSSTPQPSASPLFTAMRK